MKTTTRILLSIAAFAFAANMACAEDSYLYWMVGSDVKYSTDNTAVDYTYARVNVGGTVDSSGAVSGGTWLSPYVSGVKQTDATSMTKSSISGVASYWGDITSYSDSTTFVFELYDANKAVVGWSSVFASALASSLTTAMSGAGSAYALTSVVPEPSSALMMLLGMAGLALRRRRA